MSDAPSSVLLMLKFTNLMIPTSDHEAAVTFYRDLLGMAVVSDFANDAGRWVNLTMPDQPDVQVTLGSVAPGPGISDADRAALTELLAKGQLGFYLFTTDDLDSLFARAQASGAEVVQEPTQQPWGPKDMALRDPSGNMLRVNQGE